MFTRILPHTWLLFMAALFAGAASAQTPTAHHDCKGQGWGAGYIDVFDKLDPVTYSLKTTGHSWRYEKFGSHARGMLRCRSCGMYRSADGLFYFWTAKDLAEGNHPVHPKTVAERIARSSEIFGYPLRTLSAKHLDVVATRSDLRLGRLSGYAVLYSTSMEVERNLKRGGGFPEQVQFGILAVSATDGCVIFDTAMLTTHENGEMNWSLVESLMAEIDIERLPGQADRFSDYNLQKAEREKAKNSQNTESWASRQLSPELRNKTMLEQITP